MWLLGVLVWLQSNGVKQIISKTKTIELFHSVQIVTYDDIDGTPHLQCVSEPSLAYLNRIGYDNQSSGIFYALMDAGMPPAINPEDGWSVQVR